MSLEAVNIPRIVSRKDSSIVINWENVFPPVEDNSHLNRGISMQSPARASQSNEARIYDLRLLDQFNEWKVVYWGRKSESTIHNLKPCTSHKFKIKLIDAKNVHCESPWLEFKGATSTDQYYVHHLSTAIRNGHIAAIRKIIANRAYLLETPNIEDKTPLMQATEGGDLNVIAFLCNTGAKINAPSQTAQRTPLMIALFHSQLDVAKYLLEKKANIHLHDINGRTALHYAVDGNNVESVRVALAHGAYINARDNKGWTPLLTAVILEVHEDIINLLVAKGSDHAAVDRRGMDFKKHLELTNRSHLYMQT